MNRLWLFATMLTVASVVGCSEVDESETAAGQAKEILIDGSSTVEPISTRVAEAYREVDPAIRVSVATAGTGGGFKRFAAGETDINDASRPIKESEIKLCKEKGIDFVELMVGLDGLSVVVNKDNDFCDALTVAQLKALWQPNSQVNTWKDINPEWPDEEIGLYSPDTDSGTFDYFTEEICGKKGNSRTDSTQSANDNDLVLGVKEDRFALGYFGYAYYLANKDDLKVLSISNSDDIADAVAPSIESIKTGTYAPLSRPLYIYVRNSALERPEVAAFVDFYLGDGIEQVAKAGYVKLSDEEIQAERDKVRN